MTGPEHYERGEALLASAWKTRAWDDFLIQTPERRAELIASAQAHFTAALAAATGLTVAAMGELSVADCDSWTDVAGINSVQGRGAS